MVRETLQVNFPTPQPVPVAAFPHRRSQQGAGLGYAFRPAVATSACTLHRELRRLVGDPTLTALRRVPRRNVPLGMAFPSPSGEVMHEDPLGLARGSAAGPIPKGANQFFFFVSTLTTGSRRRRNRLTC